MEAAREHNRVAQQVTKIEMAPEEEQLDRRSCDHDAQK